MTSEHRSALSTLQRALAGAPVDPGDLAHALDHLTSCKECSRRFDVAETVAWLRSSKETRVISQEPVDPAALFESALTAALVDPDDLVRRRAAQRLGSMTGLTAPTIGALARAAAEDPDEPVRAAALTALQRLDTALSLSQWVVEVWAAAPAEAAPYLEGVLGRLVAAEEPASGVTRLGGAQRESDESVLFSGEGGVRGRLSREPDGLWLTVEGLSAEWSNAKPLVAIPSVLQVEGFTIRLAGDTPGLVAASEPVSGGTLRVWLGDVPEDEAPAEAKGEIQGEATTPASTSSPFDQIYILHQEAPRKKV